MTRTGAFQAGIDSQDMNGWTTQISIWRLSLLAVSSGWLLTMKLKSMSQLMMSRHKTMYTLGAGCSMAISDQPSNFGLESELSTAVNCSDGPVLRFSRLKLLVLIFQSWDELNRRCASVSPNAGLPVRYVGIRSCTFVSVIRVSEPLVILTLQLRGSTTRSRAHEAWTKRPNGRALPWLNGSKAS